MREYDELSLRCDANCEEHLCCMMDSDITIWDEDWGKRLKDRGEYPEYELSMLFMVYPNGFWQRLKFAWRVFRGRGWLYADYIFYPKKIRKLRDFLNKTIKKLERENYELAD